MAGYGWMGQGPARIPGVEKRIFSRWGIPAKNYNDIFLAMVRNLHILVRNLCILAKICTFW